MVSRLLSQSHQMSCLGHIGIAVPDVEKACDHFYENGVEFVKKPNEGNMKGLAFIQDPDGYWIEIFNPHTVPLEDQKKAEKRDEREK